MAWRIRGKHDEQEVDVVPRHLTIGNGSMLVNFDARLNMRDLYYPYVGLWNHIRATGMPSACGWTAGLRGSTTTDGTSMSATSGKLSLPIVALNIADSGFA